MIVIFTSSFTRVVNGDRRLFPSKMLGTSRMVTIGLLNSYENINMIKFIEISTTKLKFISYPNIKLISYFLCLVFLILWLIWSLWFSSINSSLTCQKTFLNHVDCLLQESSLLNSHITNTNIKNLKKANYYHFGKSGVIILKANPNSLSFNIIGFQKEYYYPSSSLALVLWSNFNPKNWFRPLNQSKRINQFIKGKLKQKSLVVEQSLNWIQLLIFGFFTIFIPILLTSSIIKWILTMPLKTIYEFDGISKTLLVFQNKIFEPNVTKKYNLERINQIRLEENTSSKNIMNGYIILQFNPNYDYPIDEFIDFEYGQQNFKIIQEFITRYQ